MKITHKSCKLSTIFKRTGVDQQCVDYAEWVKWRGFNSLSSTTKNTTSRLTYQIKKKNISNSMINRVFNFKISTYNTTKHFIKIWG